MSIAKKTNKESLIRTYTLCGMCLLIFPDKPAYKFHFKKVSKPKRFFAMVWDKYMVCTSAQAVIDILDYHIKEKQAETLRELGIK